MKKRLEEMVKNVNSNKCWLTTVWLLIGILTITRFTQYQYYGCLICVPIFEVFGMFQSGGGYSGEAMPSSTSGMYDSHMGQPQV